MARESRTKTHLESLVIIPNSHHGDADGDTVLAIYPIDSDDINGTPTAAYSLNENGDLVANSIDVGGGYASTGLTIAATGAVTGASTALFDSTVTSGKAGSAGSLVATGTTSGSIAITPIAAGTNATTIQNQAGGSAKVITLPSATCTLPGLGLANTFSAANTFSDALTAAGQVTLSRTAKKVPIIAGAVTDFDAQEATLTIAGLLGGIVTQNSKTGASTATTPTGTEISAGVAGVATGDTFRCMYYNRGDQTSTLTAGASGVTVYGTAAIATHKTADMLFVCTGANTWSCYVVAGA
jgi:endonuclease YncB( thermonuclease family)